jgi:hypothetical protein
VASTIDVACGKGCVQIDVDDTATADVAVAIVIAVTVSVGIGFIPIHSGSTRPAARTRYCVYSKLAAAPLALLLRV